MTKQLTKAVDLVTGATTVVTVFAMTSAALAGVGSFVNLAMHTLL